jgi:outer membrane protein assembly factor BamD (BamD/ComL family)
MMKVIVPANRFILIAILSIIILVSGCNFVHNRRVRNINKMEKKLNKLLMNDTATVSALVVKYEDFAKKYPNDSLSPEFLFRAGGICLNAGKTLKALELYKSVAFKFPGSKWTPYSVFMQAFVEDNYLRDFDIAKIHYQQVVAGYPNHPLADDAVQALEYLGKSAEEMLKEIRIEKSEDTTYLKFTRPDPKKERLGKPL